MSAHSPAEWAQSLSAGVSVVGVIGFALAFADADLADFDPRPAIVRVVESGRVDPLLIAVANARFDGRQLVAEARRFAADARQYTALSLRDAALTVAALLALLLPAAGGTQ